MDVLHIISQFPFNEDYQLGYQSQIDAIVAVMKIYMRDDVTMVEQYEKGFSNKIVNEVAQALCNESFFNGSMTHHSFMMYLYATNDKYYTWPFPKGFYSWPFPKGRHGKPILSVTVLTMDFLIAFLIKDNTQEKHFEECRMVSILMNTMMIIRKKKNEILSQNATKTKREEMHIKDLASMAVEQNRIPILVTYEALKESVLQLENQNSAIEEIDKTDLASIAVKQNHVPIVMTYEALKEAVFQLKNQNSEIYEYIESLLRKRR
jgi:hypothetical protein